MDVVAVLQKHNKWRRGEINVMPHSPREIGEAIDAACSRIAQLETELAAARKVPEGWVAVPKVPTPEMLAAAASCQDRSNIENYGAPAEPADTYAAMLAAAPQEPKP